jgi:hypothetical protein
MVENIAPMPQTAFPRVNQSASWNSRIIAKGLGGRGVVIETESPGEFVVIGAKSVRISGQARVSAEKSSKSIPIGSSGKDQFAGIAAEDDVGDGTGKIDPGFTNLTGRIAGRYLKVKPGPEPTPDPSAVSLQPLGGAIIVTVQIKESALHRLLFIEALLKPIIGLP